MRLFCLFLILVISGCSFLRSEFYRNQTDFLYAQANRAYSEGRYDEAMEEYKEVLSLDPTYSEAYVGLGHIAMVQGHRGEAIEYYEKALLLDPKLRPRLQGLIYAASLGDKVAPKDFSTHLLEEKFNQGSCEEIVEELNCKDSLTEVENFWLIRSLVRLKDYKGAALVVNKMFADQATLGKLAGRIGHLDTFLSKGYKDALEDFRTLAEVNPRCSECQYLYGVILFNNSSNYNEAIKIFEGLRRAGFCPKSLLRDLALAYEKNDMLLEAIDTYRQMGEDLFAHKRLKALYLRLGDMEEVKFYDELIKRDLSD